MNLSQIINPAVINDNNQQTHHTPVQAGLRREEILWSLRRDDGNGIRCANMSCANKAHIPRKGHKDCIGFFCQTCCVDTVRRAMERSDPIVRCSVRSHNTAAGVHNLSVLQLQQSVPPTSQHQSEPASIPLTSTNNSHISVYAPAPADDGRFISTIPMHTAGTQSMSSAALPSGDMELLTGPPTNHAMPNPLMWQRPTVGWLREHREAAARDARTGDHKKSAAETQFLHRSSVSVRIWHTVSQITIWNGDFILTT